MAVPTVTPHRMLKAIYGSAAILAALFLLFSTSTIAQTNPPQAVSVLTQALNASGTINPASAVRSLTATGTITYFGGGGTPQSSGPATLRVRGRGQIRFDATLPAGMRSIAFNGNSGARKETNGKFTQIPLHNTLSMGGSPFPYLPIAAALSDTTMTISYVGLVSSGGKQLHQVRIVKSVPPAQDPSGIVAKLSATDFFIDSQTNLIVKTTDMTHPIEAANREYPREVDFESYSTISGVAVPTVIREKITDQPIWELRVSAITFNTNLTDADFTISK